MHNHIKWIVIVLFAGFAAMFMGLETAAAGNRKVDLSGTEVSSSFSGLTVTKSVDLVTASAGNGYFFSGLKSIGNCQMVGFGHYDPTVTDTNNDTGESEYDAHHDENDWITPTYDVNEGDHTFTVDYGIIPATGNHEWMSFLYPVDGCDKVTIVPTGSTPSGEDDNSLNCPAYPLGNFPDGTEVYGRLINPQTSQPWDDGLDYLNDISLGGFSFPGFAEPGTWWLYIDGSKVGEVTVSKTGNDANCIWSEKVERKVISSPIIRYSNCQPKILVQRVNNGSNDSLDLSDIIGIENPDGNRRMWNVTEAWGESEDAHPSLSWDACWFAVQRYTEEDSLPTLWWSAFGKPDQIKRHGLPVYGYDPEVGPRGEIVYRDLNGKLMMTDRYGSFMTDLKVNGESPDFNQDGTMLTYTDRFGSLARYNMVKRQTVGRFLAGTLPHQDPNNERVFFNHYLRGNNLLGFIPSEGRVIDPLVRGCIDIAVQPGSEKAYLVHNDNQLHYSVDWAGTGTEVVEDIFDEDDERDAVFAHPDWRN